jgi:putative ABC transport system substrate-binding protein
MAADLRDKWRPAVIRGTADRKVVATFFDQSREETGSDWQCFVVEEVAIREQVLDAIRVPVDAVTRSYQRLIVELAAKHKLPAIYAAREFVDKGGLISYGVSYPDLYFRAASYVNKIFKGAKPGGS